MVGDVETLALLVGRRAQADHQIDDLIEDRRADARIEQRRDNRRTRVRTDPILLANTDQLRAQVTYGNQNKRGLSYGASIFYDVNQGVLEYMSSQVQYNTDCCGITAQYRRYSFGTRDEHQMLFSFSISNLGSVGDLARQQRMF